MRLLSPEWLLLIPVLAVAGWFWRGLKLARPLRALCLLVVTALLVQPQVRKQSDALDLWVLVDQSESAGDLLGPRISEWETILEKSRRPSDRLHFVDFAGEAVTRGAQIRAGSGTQYAGPRGATRLKSAASYTLAQIPESRASRLLVLTDGFSTEPLDGLAERLREQGVPLDYRLAAQSTVGDWRIAALALPRRVQLREAFLAEVVVLGDRDGKIPVELTRNGQSIGRRDVEVINGVGRLRFTDRLGVAGAFHYEARLMAADDAVAGNNAASQWVEVQGGPRVVLATAYENDPLAQALRAQGFEVEAITDLGLLNVGTLTGTKVVVLNNVPAYRLDPRFTKALDFFVNHQGGGLAMIGGKHSFAAGGYFGSPVEPLLPVSMELKQEHRKLAVAMAIVMDRSGSMSMTAPGTSLVKMQLANEGAARGIALLGDNDMACVYAVDSEPHEVCPLVAVGSNRGTLQNAVRRVESTGGGIYVYQGLKRAWAELEKAKVGQRHIILFADAADAEEPGEYKALLEKMSKEKGTVSVIGLGTEKDSDADFLKDVALRGNGRIFFNSDPKELPALFAQETVAVARSAFIEEPIALKGTPGWMEMASGNLEWLPKVDGYNLSYLRPGATQAAVSGDEYAAPLVAFWQRGAGRVATVSFPLGGDFSATTRSWQGYGGFAQSLARWLMGETVPPGVGLRTALEGSKLRADLFYDESWNQRIAAHAPELVLVQGDNIQAAPAEWERLAPGHYRATVELVPGTYLRGAVKIGDAAFAFGPVNAVTNPEWSFDRKRLDELKSVSSRSGGAERVDLSDVWNAPRPPAWKDFRRWLAVALVLVLLLEAWQTRTGWGAGWFKRADKQAPEAVA
ncbi:VWA domain-containing protein [Verrucomicrobium sp. BvORR034]|uniref:VWA domain-containing protein n=1 Tax=Verrucomicrobium sp. BvORR034 TaxID=1396418 RepID=UPI0006793D2A|nr:VWA domain-containing protein [Verrucomicrobium sp. BvORR034]